MEKYVMFNFIIWSLVAQQPYMYTFCTIQLDQTKLNQAKLNQTKLNKTKQSETQTKPTSMTIKWKKT